jgi:hypothetical protein
VFSGASERERSHHRSLSPREEEKRTSDVLQVLKERSEPGTLALENQERSPCSERVLTLLERESDAGADAGVRTALARVLEWTLLVERLEATPDEAERRALLEVARARAIARPDSSVSGAPEDESTGEAAGAELEPPSRAAVPPPRDPRDPPDVGTARPAAPGAGRPARRVRAPEPLWAPGEDSEYARVLEHVRSILAWANEEHGADFDVERSSGDVRRYPFETVRAAVANVLLKRARGYRFVNPGAVLWDGITLEGYKLDEFSVARLDEVLAACRARAPAAPVSRPVHAPTAPVPDFSTERRQREARRLAWESLSVEQRAALDVRAQDLARADLGPEASTARVSLRALDRRGELIESEHAAAFEAALRTVDAGSNPISGNVRPTRHEREPIPDGSIAT